LKPGESVADLTSLKSQDAAFKTELKKAKETVAGMMRNFAPLTMDLNQKTAERVTPLQLLGC
jgi:hypothetical protein